MARSTSHTNSPSGIKYYESKFGLLKEANCFLYEVCVYRLKKNEFSLYDSKLIESHKFLSLKKPSYKKQGEYLYIIEMNLIGIPIEFIRKFELPEFIQPIKNKKKK